MDNESLKKVFRNLHPKISKSVDPDSVIDELHAKEVISDDDYCNLREVQDPRNRWRELFSRLFRSSHPESFVQLRLALLDEYPNIVDEIDKQRSSLTTRQPQQPPISQSIEGKLL